MNNWNEILDKYSFFNELNKDDQQIIKDSLIIKKFETDYTLIHEGNSCLGFSLIISGSIRVYKLSGKGKEVTLYKLCPGDTCYLSISCMLSNKNYPAFAEVLEPTKIVFIPSNIFYNFIYNTMEFQKFMFENLYCKFNEVISVLEEVAFERMDVRIAKYLLQCSNYANNTKFLYLTQDKIASEVGTSREVVSRMLTDFRNKDIIASQRGKITILDFDKLNSLCSL